MNTIKGPIVLGGGNKIPKEILDVAKLPFEASNWKSEENTHLVKETPQVHVEEKHEAHEVKKESQPKKSKK